MKSAILVLGSVLACATIAQPHGAGGIKHQHQHQAIHHKRDGPVVVWETELSYVTETVDITTTIWVSSGFVPPTSGPASPSTSSTSSPTVAPTAVPAQFFEPAPSSHSEAPAPTTTTTTTSSSVYVAPTPTSTYVAPTTSTTPVHVAPVESASPAPVATAETTTAAAAVIPAPVASSAAAPAPASSAASSSNAPTSDCSPGSPCSGDMTHYDAGLGACGSTNNGTTQKVVALSHLLMGTQSNGNPFCGTTITVTCVATGKSTTAEVVDKCMGCKMWDVDLSDAVFSDIEDMGVGRTTANWYFN